MKFFFCETCGKRITEHDLEQGLGRDKKLKGVYCRQCAGGVLTVETLPLNEEQAHKLLAQTPPPAGAEAGAPSRRKTSAHQILAKHSTSRRPAVAGPAPAPAAASPRKKRAFGIGLAVTVVLIALGLYVALSVKEKAAQKTAAASSPPPALPVERPSKPPAPPDLPPRPAEPAPLLKDSPKSEVRSPEELPRQTPDSRFRTDSPAPPAQVPPAPPASATPDTPAQVPPAPPAPATPEPPAQVPPATPEPAVTKSTETPAPEGAFGPWRALLKEKSLEGWKQDKGAWSVENSVLAARLNRKVQHAVTLLTVLGDFELRFQVRVEGKVWAEIAVRQTAAGNFRLILPNRSTDGWKEVTLRASGQQVTATLDGRPAEIAKIRSPEASGKLHLYAEGDDAKPARIEFKGLEVREPRPPAP